jgi:hypothetical protein
MIEANMVTVVPEWPAYAWNCAQSPVRVGAACAPFEPLLQAAASSEAEAAAVSSTRRFERDRLRSSWLRVVSPRVPERVNIIVLDP